MPNTLPNRYFVQDEGKPSYEQLLVGPSPNVPYGSKEITLQEAQNIARQKENIPISGLGIQFDRTKLLAGQIPESQMVASWQAPWGETLTNVSQATIADIQKQYGTPGYLTPAQFKAQNEAMAQQPQQPTGATPATPTKTINDIIGRTPYQVPGGSNLTASAKAMGITLQQLLEANPEYKANPDFVRAGASLNYPVGVTSGAVSPVTNGTVEMNTDGSPAITPNTGAVAASGAGATTAGTNTVAELEKRLSDLANQKPSTEVAAEKKSILDLITKRETTVANQKSAQELRTEAIQQAYAEMGVTPEQIQRIGGLIGEITSYNQQLADLDARKQTKLDQAETLGMSAGYIAGQQNKITKEMNREIAAKAAMAGVKIQELQMIQGAYADAKQTAANIVNLMTYDQQQAVADIEWSLGAHQDLYNLLSTEEQNAWSRQYTIAKDTLATLKAEKTNVSNLMLEYPRAGILITDTRDQATAKAQKALAQAGTGLTSSIVGGFEVLKDSQGNVVQTRVAGGGGGTDLGGTNWTDLQIKTAINTILKTNPDATYEEVLQEITSDPMIANKDRAIQIAKDKFGIKEPIPESITAKKGGTSAGNNMVWTDEGTLVTREYYNTIYKERKAGITTTPNSGGWFSDLFSGLFGGMPGGITPIGK